MPILNPAIVSEKLKSLPEWTLANGEIRRLVVFEDFIAAIQFVNQVAEKAEAAGHHPDIDIRYNKVGLALISHDAGGLTDRDFDLAASIDALISSN